MIELEGIDHIALAVRDVEKSAEWYCEVLGMERRHVDAWGGVPTMVARGDTMLALFPVQSDNPKPRPGKDVIAMRHFAFRAGREAFERAQAELKARGIEFIFQDHTISHSIYFHDPDGHEVEITTYQLHADQT